MPGQINLTGANAAVQLVGNDTITEDQEFVFPDTGGTVVTDDFTGDVDIDGNVEIGASYENITIEPGVNPKLTLASAEDQPGSDANAVALQLRKYPTKGSSTGAYNAFEVRNNGDLSVTGGIEAENITKIRRDDAANTALAIYAGTFSGDALATIQAGGSARFGTYDASKNDRNGFNLGRTGDGAALDIQQKSTAGEENTAFAIWQGSSRVFRIRYTGASTFSNAFIQLDPDDETKVLDVKESIRNMQAALYRLKAAVLIPDTTVDQLRLRILEALETITEEVD